MSTLKKIFIGIVSFVSLSSQAIAKDNTTYILMDSQLNNNGQKIIFKTTVWYSKEKVRMEHDLQNTSEINLPQNMSKSIILFDLKNKSMFLMIPNNKTALKIDETTMNQMNYNKMATPGQIPSNLNTDFLYDRDKIREQIKNLGGKMTGSEVVMGHLCDIWEYGTNMTNPQTQEKEVIHSKLWISNKLNIPLKLEISSPSKGRIMSIKAKEIKLDQKFDDSLFNIPKDYQIIDTQKMMKEILQLKQNKSN